MPRGVLGFQGCRGGQGWTWSTFKSSMGTYLHPACKVFDKMAARTKYLNFAKLFYGDDSNNVWHLLVVLVCKVELI